MPRMELTEAEAEIIKARRHKLTAVLAHNRAINLCLDVIKTFEETIDNGENGFPAMVETIKKLVEPEL